MRDDELFKWHARFRSGEEVPEGWYRHGEVLAPGAWLVDLDLFVEVVLPEADWVALRGDVLVLELGEEQIEVDVPEDATLDECWTLEGCGAFEPEPGVTEEDLEEAFEAGTQGGIGRSGDLHVFPLTD